jgi:DNA-binding MarR family transcriptional regulator
MEPSEQRLHELFMELARVVTAWHLDPSEVGSDLSLSQGLALHAVDTQPPPSQQDLADRLRLEKSSVSRLVADLERRGLVTRQRDEENRRFYRLRLTDLGRTTHTRLAAAFHREYDAIGAQLTPAEREALVVGISAFLRGTRRVRASGSGAGSVEPIGDTPRKHQ